MLKQLLVLVALCQVALSKPTDSTSGGSNSHVYPSLPGHGQTTTRPVNQQVQQAQIPNQSSGSRQGYAGQVGTGYPGAASGTGYQQPAQSYPGYQQQGGYQQGGYQQGGYQQGGYPGGYQQGGYNAQQQPKQEERGFQDVLTDSLKKAGAQYVRYQIDQYVNGGTTQNRNGGYPQGGYQQGGYQQGGYQQGGYQPRGNQQGYPGGGYPNNQQYSYQGVYQPPRSGQQQQQGGVQDVLTDSLKRAGQTFVSDALTKLVSGNSNTNSNPAPMQGGYRNYGY